MASPLCGCDWPHVIPLFRDPSCGRGLSVALISHTVLGQLTSRACSTKRRLTKGSPSPPRLQGPGAGAPCPAPHDHGLVQPAGPPPEACLPHPGSAKQGVGGTQSDDMFKGMEIASKKNEV